jgi:polyisoprenoid-binding protein YceI
MKTRLVLAAALLASLLAPARPAAAADEFALDETHTSVIFGISHMSISLTYGRFNKVTGAYTLDPDPAKCKFEFAIAAESVDTNNAARDGHLRSPDFLNAEEFPLITFKSNKVAAKEEGDKPAYEVTGELEMHGVTKEVTLTFVKLGEGAGPQGNDFRTGFLCDTHLMRSDFGMTNHIPNVGDEVAITISFEGVRQ